MRSQLQDSPPSTALRLISLALGLVLLVLGLGAEPYARLDPGVAAALDYAAAPIGAPPPDVLRYLARATWVRPLAMLAPCAVLVLWLPFGPALWRAPRSPQLGKELGRALGLAILPAGVAVSAVRAMPQSVAAFLQEGLRSLAPLQLVPFWVALGGATAGLAFLGALYLRLRRPEAKVPGDKTGAEHEVI